jgi:hypothetical protein
VGVGDEEHVINMPARPPPMSGSTRYTQDQLTRLGGHRCRSWRVMIRRCILDTKFNVNYKIVIKYEY